METKIGTESEKRKMGRRAWLKPGQADSEGSEGSEGKKEKEDLSTAAQGRDK